MLSFGTQVTALVGSAVNRRTEGPVDVVFVYGRDGSRSRHYVGHETAPGRVGAERHRGGGGGRSRDRRVE